MLGPKELEQGIVVFDDLTREFLALPDAVSALQELEENTDRAVAARRGSERLAIRTGVTIRHGNASQRSSMQVEGITADLSNGGCLVLISRPLYAGDLFWLTFDDDHVRIGSLLARCRRCRFVQEDTFEVGFSFLVPVDVRGGLTAPSASTKNR